MLHILASLLAALPSVLGLVRPDGVGKLPALGWNSWNAYGCNIDEQVILEAAQKMVDLGLKDMGYQYVNIDDCWSDKSGRGSDGRLVPDPDKFPNGIKGLADKIHDMGLKIGIYSTAGTLTCAGYPASLGHEELDAQTFAEWGIDYLKYDNCNIPNDHKDICNWCNPDYTDGSNNGTCSGDGYCPSNYDYSQSNTAKRFNAMRDALEKQNRPILYSLCEWGMANVNTWGNSTGNSWRTTNDINRNWDRVMGILNTNSFYMNYVDFWGRPDPDMLEIGTNLAGSEGLTDAEQRSHFAFWAAMKGPLLTGSFFGNISDNSLALLKNKYMLAFNQDDQYGKAAAPYKWGTNPNWTFDPKHPAEYWSGQSKAGTMVLAINTDSSTKTKQIRYNEIPGLDGGKSYEITEVWSGESIGCRSTGWDVVIGSHDTAVYLITGTCSNPIVVRDGFIAKDFTA